MEKKVIEAIKKLFDREWRNLELGSSQSDLIEAHVIKTVNEVFDENHYSKKFILELEIDYDELYKFDIHHEDNWKGHEPSEAELTSSIKDEVKSWLSDLRFDVEIGEIDE